MVREIAVRWNPTHNSILTMHNKLSKFDLLRIVYNPSMRTEQNPLKLLVIVGMPGSGKTTLLEQLVKTKKISNYCDDYEFGPIKRVDPARRLEDERLLAGLQRGERWAIADTRYCDKRERLKLIKALQKLVPNLKLEFLYFENRPDLCERNVTIRKGSLPRHEINLIYYYTELYDIPDDAKVIKIHTGV